MRSRHYVIHRPVRVIARLGSVADNEASHTWARSRVYSLVAASAGGAGVVTAARVRRMWRSR